MHRAVRRTRVHRATAGTLLVAVLGGVGLLWNPSGGDNVRTGPATGTTDETAPTTVTTEPPPTTTAPEPDGGTGGTGAGDAGTTVPTSTPTTTAPQPTSSACNGQVRGTNITFTATLPAGWHANTAALGEPACHYFGAQPIRLRPAETEAGVGVASNAVVHLYVSNGPGGLPTTFDEAVADEASRAESSRRTTIDGHPAARFDELTGPGDDEPVGGDRFVHWTVDLGDVWFDAVTMLEPGMSYEEAAAGIDRIVEGLDFSV